MMSDKSEPSGSAPEPNPEPPSSSGGRPEEGDRPSGESWFDRLLSAVGLRNLSARQEIEEALGGEVTDSTFTAEERTMLANILRLRDVRVEDIMVPRADIEAVDIDETLGELVMQFRQSGHSRMPVYRESLDDPAGMVHIKDLLRAMARLAEKPDGGATPGPEQLDLSRIDLSMKIAEADLIRDVLFVPPSMPVATLLTTMQNSRMQMALVIDEYGGTDGLVSIEDAIESIVGEIEDEHDEEEPEIVPAGEGVFIADARAGLDEVSDAIGRPLSTGDNSDDIDTIGGRVFSLLGRIPAKGETVTLPEGHVVEVLDADPRRIRRLKISVAEPGDGAVPQAASGA